MAQVTGTVEKVNFPDRYGKFSMLVGERWFNSKPEWLRDKPGEGDQVEFDDKGKNYINELKIVSKGSGSPSKSFKGYSKGRDNLLGIELGHASKLAMDMTLASHDFERVGDDDFYRFWLDQTQKVYTHMKNLKSAMADTPDTIKTIDSKKVELDNELVLEDIF
jgi:hypothetical protein